MGALETRITQFGRRISNLGISLSLAVSIPLQLASGSIIKTYADIEEAALDATSLIRGATRELANGFADMAVSMSQKFPFAATELLKSVAEMERAGLTAAQSWASLPDAARNAVASNSDLTSSMEKVIGVMTAYGLRSNDTQTHIKNLRTVINVLNRTADETNATFDDMVKAFVNFAPRARLTRQDIFDTAGVLGQFHEQLLKGQRAGTLFEISMRDIGRAFIKNRELWKDQGVQVFDDAGQIKSSIAIYQELEKVLSRYNDESRIMLLNQLKLPNRSIHATMAMFGVSKAAKAMSDSLRVSADVVGEKFDIKMLGLNKRLQLLRNQLSAAAFGLGEEFLPSIETGMSLLRGLLANFRALDPEIRKSIVNWVLFAAVLGPALIGLGVLIRSFQLVFTPIILATRLIYGLGAAFLSISFMPIWTGLAGIASHLIHISKVLFVMIKTSQFGIWARGLVLSTSLSQAAFWTLINTTTALAKTLTLLGLTTIPKAIMAFNRLAASIGIVAALKRFRLIVAITDFIKLLAVKIGVLGVAVRWYGLWYGFLTAISMAYQGLIGLQIIQWMTKQIQLIRISIRLFGVVNGLLLVMRARYIAVAVAAFAAQIASMGVAGLAVAGLIVLAGWLVKVTGLWDKLKEVSLDVIKSIGDAFGSLEDLLIKGTENMSEQVQTMMTEIEKSIEKSMKNLKMDQKDIELESDLNMAFLLDQLGLDKLEDLPHIPEIPEVGFEKFEVPEKESKKTDSTQQVHPFRATTYGSIEEYEARVKGTQDKIEKTNQKILAENKKGNQIGGDTNKLLTSIAQKLSGPNAEFVAVNA